MTVVDKDNRYPRLLRKPPQCNDIRTLFDGLVIVPKTNCGIDSIGLSPTKKSKLEMKAALLAKAKTWSNAHSSNKTASKDANCAQVNFSKALKAMSNTKSTGFTETKEAARTLTRCSAKRGMQ